jgi:hypothetical protein
LITLQEQKTLRDVIQVDNGFNAKPFIVPTKSKLEQTTTKKPKGKKSKKITVLDKSEDSESVQEVIFEEPSVDEIVGRLDFDKYTQG